MTAERVLEILDALARAGVRAWVDGGWGVDALVGRQTRPHDDLDLVVALADVGTIRACLGECGFGPAEDEQPVRFVLRHASLGQLDFHTVRFDAEGGGVQPQPGGASFRYPPEGFVGGRIGGQAVECISAEVQVLCHRGYEPDAKDAADVLLLHRECGVPLPPEYRRLAERAAGEPGLNRPPRRADP